jgi:hypothetical protein
MKNYVIIVYLCYNTVAIRKKSDGCCIQNKRKTSKNMYIIDSTQYMNKLILCPANIDRMNEEVPNSIHGQIKCRPQSIPTDIL